jgi:hypothetical protein
LGATRTHRSEPRRPALQAATILLAAGLACDSDDVTAPSPPRAGARSPQELIDNLRLAYIYQDLGLFTTLFPLDSLGVDYAFSLNAPDQVTGDTDWGRTEELKVHRRMFDPEHPQPGESRVPTEYWLHSISMSLTPVHTFSERTGLGLPPKWKVWEGQYHPHIIFDLQGRTDFAVDGRANFLVIEDTEVPTGIEGKFLIYRWEDLGAFKAAESRSAGVESTSWSAVKGLYR